MEAVVRLPAVFAWRCSRLMQAAGSCSSSGSFARPVARFSSQHSLFFPRLQPFLAWSSAIFLRSPGGLHNEYRAHRALLQSEFLGSRFYRSLASASCLGDRTRPGLASVGNGCPLSGRSAVKLTSLADRSRKMSSGKHVIFNTSSKIQDHKQVSYHHAFYVLWHHGFCITVFPFCIDL